MSYISKKYRQFRKSLIVLPFFKLENGNSRAGLLGNIGSRLKYLKFLGQLIVAPEMHSKWTYFIAFCIFETLASIGRLILILIWGERSLARDIWSRFRTTKPYFIYFFAVFVAQRWNVRLVIQWSWVQNPTLTFALFHFLSLSICTRKWKSRASFRIGNLALQN